MAENKWVFPKIWEKPPKSSILIGFSIIFTIHFGGPPLFLENIQMVFPLVFCHPEIGEGIDPYL